MHIACQTFSRLTSRTIGLSTSGVLRFVILCNIAPATVRLCTPLSQGSYIDIYLHAHNGIAYGSLLWESPAQSSRSERGTADGFGRRHGSELNGGSVGGYDARLEKGRRACSGMFLTPDSVSGRLPVCTSTSMQSRATRYIYDGGGGLAGLVLEALHIPVGEDSGAGIIGIGICLKARV